jgi:hypothetical protein
MKKLLALLIATLVIGSAFSGPVRINGPGLNTEVSIRVAFSEGLDLADVALFSITRHGALNLDWTGAFDIGGMVAVDSQGFYNNECLGVSGLLSIISATAVVNPDSQNFVFGDISRSQEVISLWGCSRPAYTDKDMFI